MTKGKRLIKKACVIVLCISLCMAQFILFPSVNAYADEDTEEKSSSGTSSEIDDWQTYSR